MKVEIVSEKEEQSWDKMLEKHPFGSVFQTSYFKKVIAETFPQTKPYYLALVDQKGNMRGGMPIFLVRSWLTGTRLVSLPFAFYSDPLIQSKEEFEQLFATIMRIYKEEEASYLEIKVRDSTMLLRKFGFLTPVFYHKTYFLDLTEGLDNIWKKLHKDCIQRKIRRAEKNGIMVRRATSEDDVLSFWRLLVKTRKRLGLPPQNCSYFENIWKYLAPLQLTDFLIAEIGSEIIGGINTFKFKNTVYLGYVASKTEYWPLGVDQALLWQAIQASADGGYEVFDIGKTSPFTNGLITYKKRWGAQELETPCFYYPCLKGLSSLNNERKLTHRITTFMWKKLPDSILKMGGQFAYRHLG